MIYWLILAMLLASVPRGLADATALYARVGGGPADRAAADASDLDRLVRESW